MTWPRWSPPGWRRRARRAGRRGPVPRHADAGEQLGIQGSPGTAGISLSIKAIPQALAPSVQAARCSRPSDSPAARRAARYSRSLSPARPAAVMATKAASRPRAWPEHNPVQLVAQRACAHRRVQGRPAVRAGQHARHVVYHDPVGQAEAAHPGRARPHPAGGQIRMLIRHRLIHRAAAFLPPTAQLAATALRRSSRPSPGLSSLLMAIRPVRM